MTGIEIALAYIEQCGLAEVTVQGNMALGVVLMSNSNLSRAHVISVFMVPGCLNAVFTRHLLRTEYPVAPWKNYI